MKLINDFVEVGEQSRTYNVILNVPTQTGNDLRVDARAHVHSTIAPSLSAMFGHESQ